MALLVVTPSISRAKSPEPLPMIFEVEIVPSKYPFFAYKKPSSVT
jgi:hypothetical protein